MISRLINRPVAVTMILIAALVLGVASFVRLPVSLMPEINAPTITVRIDQPSMSAREIEEKVLKVLRPRLMQTGGLEDIGTEAKDGSGTVTLHFVHGTDMDYSFIEVNEKIDRTLPDIKDIKRPKVMMSGATDIPAFYLNMTMRDGSRGDFSNLSKFASEVIVKRIEQLDEVAMADISGLIDDEILVIPDVEALRGLGISLAEFEEALRSTNISLGSLTIHDGQYRYNVKFLSYAKTAEDIAAIYLKSGDRLFQVSDVAKVRVQLAPRTGLVRSDGRDAISIAVIKHGSARMSALRDDMDALLNEFAREYPDVDFTMTRNQTSLLDYSINSLLRNIVLAVLFSMVVIFLFMREWKPSLLVGLTIPVSLVISMIVFGLSHIGINIISLSGLILGVGMMVDNSIILVDNISGRILRGDSREEAVVKGTKEVAGPMLSSVLTTCAVFLPLLLVNGTAGELFHDEALSITIVLLVAYVITTTVIPVFFYVLPDGKPHKGGRKPDLKESGRILHWFLHNPWFSWGLLALSIAGCAVLFTVTSKEKFPPMTYSETILTVDWNEPLSIEENTARTTRLEAQLIDARQKTSMIGAQQFLLSHSGSLTMTEASIYMKFGTVREMETARKRLSAFIAAEYPQASFRFDVAGNVFDMIFSGAEPMLLARLRPLSAQGMTTRAVSELISEISAAMPEVILPSVMVKTDIAFIAEPERMALYGVEHSAMVKALRNAVNQNTLFEIRRGTRSIPVVLGSGRDELSTLFRDATVRNREGLEIPVSMFMAECQEEDFKILTAGAEGLYYPLAFDIPQSRVKDAVKTISRIVREDGHFECTFSGSYFGARKLVADMLWVLLIAVILLYLILASQFESLVQPLIILSEIAIDACFCFLFIWLSGLSINIMTMIGLIVTCGIVINDSILKIDTINRLRAIGVGLEESITTASNRRFKAIVMTSLTTVLSVLPFLSRGSMGADLQFPMSIVIVIGMVIGTAVSLFIVPAMYHSLYNSRK